MLKLSRIFLQIQRGAKMAPLLLLACSDGALDSSDRNSGGRGGAGMTGEPSEAASCSLDPPVPKLTEPGFVGTRNGEPFSSPAAGAFINDARETFVVWGAWGGGLRMELPELPSEPGTYDCATNVATCCQLRFEELPSIDSGWIRGSFAADLEYEQDGTLVKESLNGEFLVPAYDMCQSFEYVPRFDNASFCSPFPYSQPPAIGGSGLQACDGIDLPACTEPGSTPCGWVAQTWVAVAQCGADGTYKIAL